jgi:hypothetical protein
MHKVAYIHEKNRDITPTLLRVGRTYAYVLLRRRHENPISHDLHV